MDEQNCIASSNDSNALLSTFRFYQGVPTHNITSGCDYPSMAL